MFQILVFQNFWRSVRTGYLCSELNGGGEMGRLFFMGLICSGFAFSCFAQPIGYSVQMGPISVNCVDGAGNSVVNHSGVTGQAAMSTFIGGQPAIVLDFQSLWKTPLEFGIFTYAHECAHHYLGHVINASYVYVKKHELDADCAAAKVTRNYGLLSPAGFGVAMSVLSTFPGDIGHPPGPVRVQNATACYNTVP
jgi:hypothetical protein